jgi:hypothetical protein
MADLSAILSLNPDGQTLRVQESALRDAGFQVISVSTPLQARFEIELGRCGVFLTGYITPLAIYQNLAGLFRVNCPPGLIIYLTQHADDTVPVADIVLSEEDEPRSIVEQLRSKQETKAS